MAKDEEDSDVIIEDLLVAKEAEIGASPVPAKASSSEERGDPSKLWRGHLASWKRTR